MGSKQVSPSVLEGRQHVVLTCTRDFSYHSGTVSLEP